MGLRNPNKQTNKRFPNIGLIKTKQHTPPIRSYGKASHKEVWEENGNTHSHNSDTVMGMGREPGFLWKAKAGNFFLRIASESQKVFARIFVEFLGVQVSQKQEFFDGQFKLF